MPRLPGVRRFFACLLSRTCVVEMFTTAGSTRFTMDAKLFEEGITSGIASGLASLAAKSPMLFIAETRPETIVPMRIPTVSVSTRKARERVLATQVSRLQ